MKKILPDKQNVNFINRLEETSFFRQQQKKLKKINNLHLNRKKIVFDKQSHPSCTITPKIKSQLSKKSYQSFQFTLKSSSSCHHSLNNSSTKLKSYQDVKSQKKTQMVPIEMKLKDIIKINHTFNRMYRQKNQYNDIILYKLASKGRLNVSQDKISNIQKIKRQIQNQLPILQPNTPCATRLSKSLDKQQQLKAKILRLRSLKSLSNAQQIQTQKGILNAKLKSILIKRPPATLFNNISSKTIQKQNAKQFYSFIKGGYIVDYTDIQGDYLSLDRFNKSKQQFITLNKFYNAVKPDNLAQRQQKLQNKKIALNQSFKSLVQINEIKNEMPRSQLNKLMKICKLVQ